jgi:SAM-dependent methyltransferase
VTGALYDPAREEAELRAYLGERYDHERLVQYDLQLEHELHDIGDEQRLYRESEAYLYNLTAFAMTGTKVPYLEALTKAVPAGSAVLDYGCGIGSDGLVLLEAGYRVTFADFDNPSTRYLRWRLERRGLEAQIVDLDAARPPTGFDLAYAFDVIEHVEDPLHFLGEMERAARLVLVNLLEPVPGETALHHDLPVAELIQHAAGLELLEHTLHHGRSHLLLYASAPARGLRGARSRRRAARALRWG